MTLTTARAARKHKTLIAAHAAQTPRNGTRGFYVDSSCLDQPRSGLNGPRSTLCDSSLERWRMTVKL